MSLEIEWLLRTDPGGQKFEGIQYILDMVNLSDISSIKSSVNAIIVVINNPRSTVKELKEVIMLDPPLAARVLKTANSAYYSRSFTRTFSDIEQAIIWMGSEIIKELALSQKVCEIFDKDEAIEGYSRKALWRHSIAVALLSKMIYRKEFGLPGENAYVAGLLHDIGVIAEDQFFQEDFKRVLQLAKSKKISMPKAEYQVFGYDHAEVGQAMTYSWGLPGELALTIGHHNNPLKIKSEFSRIVSTLHVADHVCQAGGFSYGAVPVRDDDLFQECLNLMDVKPYALDLILKGVKQEISKMEDKGLL
jgi:putative nucleotidyltransferase with HDIG domain